jgi:hypothetical protein
MTWEDELDPLSPDASPMTDREKVAIQRYRDAYHAVQSGVAFEMAHGNNKAAEPKHLRVGINGAMCDHTALVRLLVSKGILTREEYTEAIADEMEREQRRYEETNGVSFA